MDASVAAKTNRPELSKALKVASVAANLAGAAANPFAFTASAIASLILNIAKLKTHPDQQYSTRALPSTSPQKQAYVYEQPVKISVPGQQPEVAQVASEPGIKIQAGILHSLKAIYELTTDPQIKTLAKAALQEQQKLNGVA